MTDYVLMPEAHYRDICNAVRQRSGKTEPLCSGELAGEIQSLPDGFYDAFWDAYQQNGERVNYYQRFAQDGWNDATFQPKYPIVCRNGSTNGRSVFSNARMTCIPVPVIIMGVPAQETFYRCTKLVTISRLVLDGATDCTGIFNGCSALENLNIEGSIDVNISIAAAELLSAESVQKVLGCLKDLTGQATQTLTLHNTVGSALTDAQKAIVTAKNWTLAY